MIITIDGPSGVGKGTVAKIISEKLNIKYLDSGAMYRAITLYLLRNKISYDNEDAIRNNLKNIIITFKYVEGNQNTFLNNENVEMEIRGDKISNNVSKYSSISIIREHLVSIQKQMGKRKKIVVEGRDITTVVFPDAEIKIFMTADIEVRAKRRFEDMKNNNPEVTYSDVLENLSERDSKDSNRKDSPLRVADEAIVIDTSDLEINEQTHKIIDIIKNKF